MAVEPDDEVLGEESPLLKTRSRLVRLALLAVLQPEPPQPVPESDGAQETMITMLAQNAAIGTAQALKRWPMSAAYARL